MERITDSIPDDVLERISLENLSDLDLIPKNYEKMDPEQVTNEIAIILGKFSNVDINKGIQERIKEYRVHGNFLDLQWAAAQELVELGERHIKKVINAVEEENLSEPIRQIPYLAAAFILYTKVYEGEVDDVTMVNIKNDFIQTVEILAGNGRAIEALELLTEAQVPSILKESRKRFLESIVLVGDPVSAANILEKIDPEVQFLVLRGNVISRLEKIDEIDKAISLAKGRDEKGNIPSTYYTIPLYYVKKGKSKEAAKIIETLFPENKLMMKALDFVLIWCKDHDKMKLFEEVGKELKSKIGRNHCYVQLFMFNEQAGHTELASQYEKKIDLDVMLESFHYDISLYMFCRMLEKMSPTLYQKGLDHFGL